MNNNFEFSIFFSNIDNFILAMHELDSQGFTLEDFSIEGPPCLLVKDFQYGSQTGNLLVIVYREMSTMYLFGQHTTQLRKGELDLTIQGKIYNVQSFWSNLKGKYKFLERTELFLRNKNNFDAEFIFKNRTWFTDDG